MYKVDVYLRVRRAVMVEGKSIREVSREFGLHRDTVRKMLAYSVPPGYRRQTPPRRPKLEPFTGVIDRILEDDLRRPRKQRHTAKRIYERLRDEYGYDGGYTTVKDYVRQNRRMIIPHYWNPQQVERLLDSLAVLGLRRARVAALIMWRTGLRVGETVAPEWRDIDVTSGSLLVRRGKGGRGRTVPLHPDLASLFANWPASYGPRDPVVGLTRKTALRHLRAGIEHADLDDESPGTGRQRAGAHSLRHSAARHWLTNVGILGRPLTRGAYSTSKGAVLTFTKTTAIQHATENIRCNSIHPGPVDTPMLANISDNPEVLRQRTDEVPLGRLGVSRDIAYGALYLASHEATWITGIELIIDGGITAK